MKNKRKQKRRLNKLIARRQKETEKEMLAIAWRNVWIKSGVLKG